MDRLDPGAVTYEHTLEHRWSEGRLWNLIPAPAARVELRIRVGGNFALRALRVAGGRVHLIWLPHAAGSETGSEIVARLAGTRGWSVTSILPPPDIPPPGAPLAEWVDVLEARVRAGRDALRASTNAEGECTVLAGVSVGGVAALRIAELEPSVDGVIALLAGSGTEGFVHGARAYGASKDALNPEDAPRLSAVDPVLHAAALQGRPALLGRALFDGVVPRASFDELVSALNAPTVRSYPTGHESFAYILPVAVRSTLRWADDMCRSRELSRHRK